MGALEEEIFQGTTAEPLVLMKKNFHQPHFFSLDYILESKHVALYTYRFIGNRKATHPHPLTIGVHQPPVNKLTPESHKRANS